MTHQFNGTIKLFCQVAKDAGRRKGELQRLAEVDRKPEGSRDQQDAERPRRGRGC